MLVIGLVLGICQILALTLGRSEYAPQICSTLRETPGPSRKRLQPMLRRAVPV